ncbi:MAG: helix-turn-helix domain-containing protein, partial [Streptosporangiaceae bacterium]
VGDARLGLLTGTPARVTGGPARVTGGPARVTGGSARVTGGSARVTGGSARVTGGSARVTGEPGRVTGGPACAPQEFPADLLDALRRAVDRGARVLSVCSGAFILGEAGLLDGRRCTTHWRHADELARRFPQAKVDPDVLYVDDDPVISSAGTAAGIDACLYLVRKEQGSRVANGIARRMVVPPHRDGGQAQYVEQPIAPSCDGSLRDLLEWLSANLGLPLTVRQLATRANMSERTFARRFVQDTGTTPQRWLIGQRILLAQQLLEETDETVDAIADHAGFGNATALRHHFRIWRGTTPNAYRRLFRGDPASTA